MIEVKNLHKSFGGTKVLKGVSTIFESGKTNLIIGQSGSGKTVLLKCLLGLFNYEKGSISYDEKLFLSLSDNEKRTLRSQIGMVFQGGALFDSLTCLIVVSVGMLVGVQLIGRRKGEPK